jgi:hypothetical protein
MSRGKRQWTVEQRIAYSVQWTGDWGLGTGDWGLAASGKRQAASGKRQEVFVRCSSVQLFNFLTVQLLNCPYAI